MKSEDPAIEHFVEAWIAEFGRAVEMFSGQAPEIRHRRAQPASILQPEFTFWVRQAFSDNSSFTTWIGAQEPTWRHLGALAGESSPEGLRSTYREIVNQAQEGCASVINSSLAKTIRCETPETCAAATFDPSQFVTFDIALVGAGVPGLSFAIELLANQVLDTRPLTKVAESGTIASSETISPPLLASLLTLTLPVSVSLGQGELELKTVLLAGPGSVIPLQKDVSEPVDLIVQGRVVARGELVLVRGHYGLRVKSIISRQDRLTMCNS